MTNKDLQAIIDYYGGPEYVIGLFFDNPGAMIINYPTTPKWTSDPKTSDIVLKTIDGLDVIEVAHLDRTEAGLKGENGVWFITVHPTEHLQRISFADPNLSKEELKYRKNKPQETKIYT